MTTKTKNKSPSRKICEDCNSSKPLGEFYNADKMFFPTGKMHICKDCALKIVEKNGHDGFLGLLRMLDKPLYQDLYKEDVPDYVRMMNSMPQYRNVGYNDSDSLKIINSVSSIKREKPKELSEEEMQNSEEFWGEGFSEKSLIWLNNELQEYGSQYDISAKAMENLIKEVCLTQLDIRNKRADSKDVKNELKTLQDLLGSSNMKPQQESGANSVDQETFGTLIKKWENERPIPEPDEMWKDVDNIGRYIRTFFLGHMARMFNKENPYQDEYEEEIGKYTVSPPREDD